MEIGAIVLVFIFLTIAGLLRVKFCRACWDSNIHKVCNRHYMDANIMSRKAEIEKNKREFENKAMERNNKRE